MSTLLSIPELLVPRGVATIIALFSENPTTIVEGTEIPLERFGPLEPFKERTVRALGDLNSLGPEFAGLRGEGIRSLINVPMLAQGELIGALNIGFDVPNAFASEHIEIAQEVSSTLAVAIQQAELHEQIGQHAASLDARVAERTAELRRSENRLAAIVSSLPDPVFVLDEDGRYAEILTTQIACCTAGSSR